MYVQQDQRTDRWGACEAVCIEVCRMWEWVVGNGGVGCGASAWAITFTNCTVHASTSYSTVLYSLAALDIPDLHYISTTTTRDRAWRSVGFVLRCGHT